MTKPSIGILLLALLCISCDRKQTTTKVGSQEQFHTQMLLLDTVAQLEPGKQTHLAIMPTGEIYMVQETPGGQDVVYCLDSANKLRATSVNSAKVMEKLGLAGGEGNIQSIAIAGKDRIWFYLAGRSAEKNGACVGEYRPSTDQWRVLFDTEAIRSASRLGSSLEEARGKLIRSGGAIWLWLRGREQYSLQRMELSDLDAPSPRLPEPADPLQFDNTAIPLQRREYDLAAGTGSSLLVLDLRQGAIWITRGSELKVICSLVGLPQTLSQPAMGDNGMVMAFVADGPPLDIPDLPPAEPPKFPALLMAQSDKLRWIGREDIRVPAGVNVGGLKLQQMEAEKPQQWIGYDETSGKLLCLKLVDKLAGTEAGPRR